MARISKKTGLRYVTGTKFTEQDKWKVTVKEAFEAIRSDPDLRPHEKAQAIRILQQKLGEMLQTNSAKERMALLNQIYQKKHGVLANQTTPMADFTRRIILRRNKY